MRLKARLVLETPGEPLSNWPTRHPSARTSHFFSKARPQSSAPAALLKTVKSTLVSPQAQRERLIFPFQIRIEKSFL